ncbi:MAG: NAD(P)H-hydrate dehydratase [Lachnospiraceae bacterium]|nr:NAD(P)H-hydrate dehydratase [Lachnospiraceae bacterium]
MDYILTGKTSKEVDTYCIDEIGIPSLVLQERAALAVADETIQYLRQKEKQEQKILVLCMPGNNGADGIAAARLLSEKGYPCEIWIIGDTSRATREFQVQWNIAKKMELNIRYLKSESESPKDLKLKKNLESSEDFGIGAFTVVIDAMFGIGLSREVSGIYAKLIKQVNGHGRYKIAVDIASGLNAETGCVMGEAVRADVTVTFGAGKAGHFLCEGKNHTGKLVIKDIGFLKSAFESVKMKNPDFCYACHTKEDLNNIPRRSATSHKGTYGTVNVIGGGANMSGAVALSASAAYRCGAGLVKIYAGKQNLDAVKVLCREAVIGGYAEFDADKISEGKDIIVAGPGLSVTDEALGLVRNVLSLKCKIILDADALNVISENRILLEQLHENVVVTPHIKEMARLIERDTAYVREHIVECARQFSRKYHCVTVIKDAATVISSPEGEIRINTTGNSGMSKGGSGDVLTGVIAGLMAQKLPVYEAASMGVYLHGMAGDFAAEEMSEYSMLASDIVNKIPEVFKLEMEK